MKRFNKLLVYCLMLMLYLELRFLEPLDDVVKVSTDDLGTLGFNHLAIHKDNGTVYIGAVGQLYRLTSDLHLLANTTVARNSSHKNHNKILIIDYTNKELIACTKTNEYLCFAYDITALSNSLNPTKMNRELITGSNTDASVVAFIGKTFSHQKDYTMFQKMYVGVSYQDDNSKERAITARYLKSDKFLQLNENDKVPFITYGMNGTLSFDSMFRNDYKVNYIYGFNVEKYNYFLTTQKHSASTEYSYISKLIRICSDDDNFWRGYVEIPIECKYDNEQPYNLVQMAHIGKPGLQLAQSLNTGLNEVVLFGIFSRSEEMNVPSNKPSNQSAICIYSLEAINKKFLKNIQNCYKGHGTRGFGSLLSENRCKEENQFLPSNFCPSSENMPLEGNMPISAYPAITFNSLLTAIASNSIDNESVVFVGTNAGYLKKVRVNNSSSTCEQASILIDDGSPVNSDLLFSPNGEYLYVMTEHNLRRINISQISVDNCSGYVDYTTCIHTSSNYCGWCGLTNKCTSKCDCYQGNYALWYSHDFRKDVQIMPNCRIRFQIGFVELLNLTVVGLPLLYDEFYCAFTFGNETFTTEAINYANKIYSYVNCSLPSKNQISPLLKNNEKYFDSTLSLQTNQIKDIGKINITFFDCNTYTTCRTCVKSTFSCQWNSWEKNCQYDWETTSHNSSINRYEKMCKEVTSIVTQNTTQRGPTTHFDNIKTNSQQYTARSSTSRSSSSPSTYIPPVSMKNSHKKCKSMAHNCSACLSLNKALRCSWCQSTNACEFYDDCTTSEFLDHNDTCINPSPPTITSFWPLKGPLEGGTNVTIEGKNLGCEFEDVRQSIEVAGVVCMTYKCIPMKSITCTINSSSSLLDYKGPVEVLVNGISVKSKQNFEFVDVKITDISPKRGPTYGDTALTISGKNLDAGKSVHVFVGNKKCTVFLKNSFTIQCFTPSYSTEEAVEISVVFDKNSYNSTNGLFIYSKDTQRDENGSNIVPMGIVSGGIKILLCNLSLPSTQPLTLHVHDGERTYNSLCEIQKNFSATRICLSPPIPHYDTLDMDNPREMNVSFTSNGTSIQPFSNPRNQSYKFWLYPDPIFNYFINSTIEYCEDKFLIIMGSNISKACQKIDIKVNIGNTSCEAKSISPNQVVCLLPKNSTFLKNDSLQDYDLISEHDSIIVSVGNRPYPVPKQKERKEQLENLWIKYIISSVIISMLIILLIIASRCITRKNSALRKLQQQINTMGMETITLKQYMKRVIIKNKISLDENSTKALKLPTVEIKNTSNPRINAGTSAECEYILSTDNKWEFSKRNLTLGRCLGEGEFGKVVLGKAKDILRENITTTVAVKMLKDNHSDRDMIDLVSEMEIMKLIGTHVNVLRLLGCCTQEGDLFVIMEYARHGNLREFLRKHLPSDGEIIAINMPLENLIMFAVQVAKGMEYLSSIKCIHRDLAARNILVFEDYILKIADFGLSRDITNKNYYRRRGDGRVPVKWMAPESLCHNVYSIQSDVWSYGVLLWEIFTLGGVPYPSLVDTRKLYQALRSGYRMEIPPNCPVEIYSLMHICWSFQPKNRPSFSTIVKNLQEIPTV